MIIPLFIDPFMQIRFCRLLEYADAYNPCNFGFVAYNKKTFKTKVVLPLLKNSFERRL